jgi:hypothetical protein
MPIAGIATICLSPEQGCIEGDRQDHGVMVGNVHCQSIQHGVAGDLVLGLG